jgi:NADH dehydrogenase
VRPDLRVLGHDNVFVIGDCASLAGADGKPLPGVAPVAKQQGQYVAKLIAGTLHGKTETKPFAYKDYGNLATVGRKAAIADIHGFHLRGFIGWLFWSAAHIYFLIGFRNRLAVTLDWAWSYITFERGARLITGDVAAAKPAPQTKREAA